MPNWCINQLTITVPESIGNQLIRGLELVRDGVDPYQGAVSTDDLFQDKDLNKARTAAGVGLLEFLAPLYTFVDPEDVLKSKIYSPKVRVEDIWGTTDISEFDMSVYTVRTQNGVPLMDINISFTSRWSPPVGAMNKFIELVPEADLLLFYAEPGGDFCGEVARLRPEMSNVSEPVYRQDLTCSLSVFCDDADKHIADLDYIQDTEIQRLAEAFGLTFAATEWIVYQFIDTVQEIRDERIELEGPEEDEEEAPEGPDHL
jgi:hypothetical protein